MNLQHNLKPLKILKSSQNKVIETKESYKTENVKPINKINRELSEFCFLYIHEIRHKGFWGQLMSSGKFVSASTLNVS